MTVDGAPVSACWTFATRPLVSVFLPRPPRVGQGCAGVAPRTSGPVRLGAVAGAERDAARLRTGARAAQLADRRGSAAGAPPPRSLAAWDIQLARSGFALMDDRERAVVADRRAVRGSRRAPGPGRIVRQVAYRPRSRPPQVAELAGELAERCQATLSVDSRRMGRIVTMSRSLELTASCGRSVRRASSGWRSWRCCSPSARRSPSCTARLR